ncbi:hypothetical protein AC578_2817 [Pseudocercospora eumusae]|uniref:Uncharacterized protein n=1 Tax=Pseudocercospora eumusae TaxID=321146 RepID=A0A139H151_9PEZI|nr:hypothetical protein AC578_2817 [Pseudocercospora eumusae]
MKTNLQSRKIGKELQPHLQPRVCASQGLRKLKLSQDLSTTDFAWNSIVETTLEMASLGWKRWAGAIALGSTAPFVIAFVPLDPEERAAKRQRLFDNVRSRFQYHTLLQEGSFASKPFSELPDETSRALKPFGSSFGGNSGGSGPGKKHPGMVKSNGGNPNDPDNIVRIGPHLGQEVPGESEPLPIPHTNYVWKSDKPIEDLEQHLKMLRERREKLALEAELLWSWLSEKELDYYNSPGTSEDSPDKAAKLRYLETLGSVHTKTWLEASSCDWMIADSKKRIEQLRSAATNNGKVSWRAVCSDLAAKKSPDHALTILRVTAQGIKQKQEQLEKTKHNMALTMVNPDFEEREEEVQVFDPIQKKMVSGRDLFQNARNMLEELLKQTNVDQETVEQVIADAEKRQK